MARNGHPSPTAGCLLSGVKRKSASASSTSEFDPLRHQPGGILGGHNKKAFAKGLRCARNRRDGLHLGYCEADYLNSVAYLRAISLTCSRVSCFGGTPGGLHVSRKKPSKPGGAMIQSRSSS